MQYTPFCLLICCFVGFLKIIFQIESNKLILTNQNLVTPGGCSFLHLEAWKTANHLDLAFSHLPLIESTFQQSLSATLRIWLLVLQLYFWSLSYFQQLQIRRKVANMPSHLWVVSACLWNSDGVLSECQIFAQLWVESTIS